MRRLYEYIEMINAHYDAITTFIIRQFGALLYLGYEDLPETSDFKKDNIAKYVIDYNNIKDEEERYEFEEWVSDGMRIGGKALLSKQLIDSILHAAEKPISSEIKVFRTGNNSNGWISFSKSSGLYNSFKKDEKEKEYILPKGTKIIDCYDLADKDEILIHYSELKGVK